MPQRVIAAVFLLLLFAFPVLAADQTALDRYVAAPDPDYRYELLRSFDDGVDTAALLRLTSLRWRSPAEVDRPLWAHYLTIIRPQRVTHDIGLLVISGGSNDKGPPSGPNPFLAALAINTGSVVSELRMVPNEPLTFAGETAPRSEDAIVAYSWDRYLKAGDATWPVELPMTKSAVRAMDAVTDFSASAAGGGVAVRKFVVEGASKRGWTTWLTAAADRRVVAIVPVVADLLDLEPSFEHQHNVYGFWAPALADYQRMGIMNWVGTPQMDALLRLVDPYAYRSRLTMPKFIINSAGDQFFLPDSWRFYLDGLPGQNVLRYVPNSNHSLHGSDAAESAAAFYDAILDGRPLPAYTWRFEPDGAIRFETKTKPASVLLWQATNPKARDFRLETIGRAYTSEGLKDEGGGVYLGRVAGPNEGYVAYFVEATYDLGAFPFKVTSGVRVLPDIEPYAAKSPGQ